MKTKRHSDKYFVSICLSAVSTRLSVSEEREQVVMSRRISDVQDHNGPLEPSSLPIQSGYT